MSSLLSSASVHILSVLAVQQQDDGIPVSNFVPHPIVTDPDTLLVFIALQLDTSGGPRILLQRQDPFNDSIPDPAR